MYGAILAIGDELTQGRVSNTTSFWAAHKLFITGYEIREIVTVPDDLALISVYLSRFLKEYNFVLVSGGLGPTTDDLTNEAVAKTLNLPLITNEEILSRIRKREKELGLPHNPLREKMAQLPEGAKLLTSEKAMAGYYLLLGEKIIFCLPGVPKEFNYLLETKVIPILKQYLPCDYVIYYTILKLFGLREADINIKLRKLEKDVNLNIGYYPVLPEIHLFISARDKIREKAQERLQIAVKEVENLFGEHIFGRDEDTLEAVVGRLLLEHHKTLAVAESCTGGLIASRITRVPGSSSYFERAVVTYSNQAKKDILGVPKEYLEKFGAVSKETALAMAEGIRRLAKTDYGISVTGIAGPTGGTPQKPVGTVWIGFSCEEGTVAQCFLFPGDRHMVQSFAATTALDWLRRYLCYGSLLPCYQFIKEC